MITGIKGLDLSTLVGTVRRRGPQPPPSRGLQPVPGKDTIQFSVRGNYLAGAGEGAAVAGHKQGFAATFARGSGVLAQFQGGRAAQVFHQADGTSVVRMRATQAAKVPTANGLTVVRASRTVNVVSGPQGKAVTSYQSVQSVNVTRPPINQGAGNTRPVEEGSLMDRIKASFFSRTGDARFDATLDLNADGAINHADLAAMRDAERPAGPKALLAQVQNAFFSQTGEGRFNAAADVNNDGVVNFSDLALLRAKIDGDEADTRPVEPIPVVPEQPEVEVDPASGQPRVNPDQDNPATYESLRNAIFSNNGDATFNASADLNGDGRVDFADLAALRQREEQA